MAITPLPPAPEPTDTTSEFNAKAFAWVASLETFVTETNATATAVDSDASTATTQAGIATTQAGIATTQAGIATTQAGNAATSASNALTSANNAAASYDAFDDRYLGSKSSDPSLDNDGNALISGAVYWNTSDNVMKVYTGSAWVAAINPISMPDGTANGVAYLNGSKVLTTGSALTFDGTNLGLYVGGYVEVKSANKIYFNDSGNTNSSYINNGGTNANLSFGLGASEQMRLTSTGLGIGTSSPATKLVVARDSTTGGTPQLILQGATNSNQQLFVGYDTSANVGFLQPLINGVGYKDLVINPNGGNLGLGVTPSAWTAGVKAIDIGVGSAVVNPGSNAQTWYLSNAYHDSGFKYKNSAEASWYQQVGGAHAWYTAPSGTAGNAISFTQAMTLDASGNLSVGTTSTNGRLTIQKTISGATDYVHLLAPSDVTGDTFGVVFGTPNYNKAAVYGINENGGNGAGALAFYTTTGANASTERMRIDSSGNLLVGTTSTGTTNSNSFTFQPPLGYTVSNHINGTASGTAYSYYGYNGTSIGSITQNGTTAVAYNTSSDYRLKENIQPMQNALAVVQRLNPVTYTWKADGSDGQGFIAHELQAVVPDCVTGEKDAVDEDGKPVYQGIDTSFLVATLTKAIQEQQELINQLTARVAQLEGN